MMGEIKPDNLFFFAESLFSIFLLPECIKILEVKSICARGECVREAFGLRRGTPYITWEIGRRYFLISNARPLEKNVGVTLQEEEEAAERGRKRQTCSFAPENLVETKDYGVKKGELVFLFPFRTFSIRKTVSLAFMKVMFFYVS